MAGEETKLIQDAQAVESLPQQRSAPAFGRQAGNGRAGPGAPGKWPSGFGDGEDAQSTIGQGFGRGRQ